jgi:ascorbate-specific PTS system EIIC-type component UlaA
VSFISVARPPLGKNDENNPDNEKRTQDLINFLRDCILITSLEMMIVFLQKYFVYYHDLEDYFATQ